MYLKQVGKLWLYNQMCHMVDIEVKLNQLGLQRYLELDNKKVIDVIGVGLKYFPWSKRKIQDDDYDDFELSKPEQYEIGYNVLRGIEVKVSKSDFKNGFVCTSANYNYVMAPTKLVSPNFSLSSRYAGTMLSSPVPVQLWRARSRCFSISASKPARSNV